MSTGQTLQLLLSLRRQLACIDSQMLSSRIRKVSRDMNSLDEPMHDAEATLRGRQSPCDCHLLLAVHVSVNVINVEVPLAIPSPSDEPPPAEDLSDLPCGSRPWWPSFPHRPWFRNRWAGGRRVTRIQWPRGRWWWRGRARWPHDPVVHLALPLHRICDIQPQPCPEA